MSGVDIINNDDLGYVENVTFPELEVGASALIERVLTEKEINLFAIVSGDYNPAHLDPEFAKATLFEQVIGHGIWGGVLVSTILGTRLPGPGTIYLNQSLRFQKPIHLGDRITVKLTVKSKNSANNHVVFDCECINQLNQIVTQGEAEVIAPTEKIRRKVAELPQLILFKPGEKCHRLIDEAKKLTFVMRTAIVHPASQEALVGAINAAQSGIITPIIIGPMKKILKIAESLQMDLSPYECIDVPHSHAAAYKAVEMCRGGKVDALMKGSLHTEELMQAVVQHESGLRTDRRISHAFVIDSPSYPSFLIISDAAINIAPNLNEKRDITQNSIDLAHAIGIKTPKVAILAATEEVEMIMPATIDAAALSKMAERGQITGAIVDGPLAFDNAISKAAAVIKHINSPVAGHPDILIVPEIEAGNMLAKQMTYLGAGNSAGIVLGAKVPIILTSRADNALSREASCALAKFYKLYLDTPPNVGDDE